MITLISGVALLCGLAGLVLASEATLGAVLVAFGCLLCILVRIDQANRHHIELRTGKTQAERDAEFRAAQLSK